MKKLILIVCSSVALTVFGASLFNDAQTIANWNSKLTSSSPSNDTNFIGELLTAYTTGTNGQSPFDFATTSNSPLSVNLIYAVIAPVSRGVPTITSKSNTWNLLLATTNGNSGYAGEFFFIATNTAISLGALVTNTFPSSTESNAAAFMVAVGSSLNTLDVWNKDHTTLGEDAMSVSATNTDYGVAIGVMQFSQSQTMTNNFTTVSTTNVTSAESYVLTQTNTIAGLLTQSITLSSSGFFGHALWLSLKPASGGVTYSTNWYDIADFGQAPAGEWGNTVETFANSRSFPAGVVTRFRFKTGATFSFADSIKMVLYNNGNSIVGSAADYANIGTGTAANTICIVSLVNPQTITAGTYKIGWVTASSAFSISYGSETTSSYGIDSTVYGSFPPNPFSQYTGGTGNFMVGIEIITSP